MAIKVFGAGLARTGTMSLKIALEQLGYDNCYHMIELLKDPSRLKYLKEFHKTGKTDWDSFFADYQSAVDHPVCLYYQEMLKVYPDAKVILTVRDPERWYYSVYRTVYRGKPKGPKDIFRMIWNMIWSKDMRRVAPVFMHNDKLIWSGQFQSRFEDKDFAIQVYNDHVSAVKAFVPAEQLLVYEIQSGWEPLCAFLGKPVPDLPFPRANEQDEFNRKMDRLLIDGVFEA